MEEANYYTINYSLLSDETILQLYIETFGNPVWMSREAMVTELQRKQEERLYVVSRDIEEDA